MNSKGSLLVEFVLGVCFLVSLLVFFEKAFHLVQRRQQVLLVARLGTALQTQTTLPEADVNAYVDAALRQIDFPSGSSWSVETGRYLGTAAARFYTLMHTRVTVTTSGWGNVLTFSEETIRHKEVN